jgi:TP901 family phage tail tape measure protein
MDFLPPVVAKLMADVGEFNAALGASTAKLEGFEAANKKLAGAGKVAMAGLALAAAGAAIESVHLAANFDQAMELIHTQAGAAQSEVDGLKQKVLDLAPAVGIGPEKLAEGLYHIESTGFRGKEALDILTASAKLAAMGLADLDTVTFAMSGVMSSAMKDVTSAADATNYLNTIVGMGDMKMDKLAAAIGTGVLPSFKNAGLGMKDFGAALATITDNSVGADEAATRLRMTVSLMAAPSHAAKVALQSIGISEHQLADDMRGPGGLLGAVMDLKAHLEASGKTASEQNAIIMKAFGGGRTSSAILTLLEESDRLKSKYGQLGDSASRAKTADEAWAAQQKQFSQQMHQLGAELQSIGVTVGNFLIPYIQKSAEWMSKHTEVVKIAAIVIGGVLVAAMMAFTYAVIANTIAMLANPITWIVLAIVAAVALLAVGIYELVKHWGAVWGFIKRISLDVWHWLVDAWNWTWNKIMAVVGWIKSKIIDPIVHFFNAAFVQPTLAVWHKLHEAWNVLWAGISWVLKFSYGFWSVIVKAIKADIDTIVVPVLHFLSEAWDKTWNLITTVAKWAWDKIIRPVFKFIVDEGIGNIKTAIHWLSEAWDKSWGLITTVAKWAWDKVLSPTLGFIDKYGIQPVQKAAKWLEDEWSKIWHGIGDALQWVWDHTLGPVFDKVEGGLNKIKEAWDWVKGHPSESGGGVASGIAGAFDNGGWVPGPAGAPRLILAHAGEYVLSREMIAAGSRGGAAGSSAAPAAPAGHAEAGAVIVAKLYVDGKELHARLIPHAQRYKDRTGTTGLS